MRPLPRVGELLGPAAVVVAVGVVGSFTSNAR